MSYFFFFFDVINVKKNAYPPSLPPRTPPKKTKRKKKTPALKENDEEFSFKSTNRTQMYENITIVSIQENKSLKGKNLVERERFQLIRLTGARLSRFSSPLLEFDCLLKLISQSNKLTYRI